MKKLLPNVITMICVFALFSVNLTGNNPNENFCFDADVPEAQANLAGMCLTAPFIMCPSTYLGCPSDNLDPSNTGMATATAGDAFCPTPILSYTDVVTTNTACLKVVHRTWEATYPPGTSIKLHSTCQQTLYLEDTTAPIIANCPSNMTIDLANNCAGIATWPIPTASDDCGLLFFSTTHYSGTAFPLGNTTVTYTAQDNCGQQAACSFNISVVGSCCTGPSINCPSNYITCPGGNLDPSTTGTATANQPDPSCPTATVSFSDAIIQDNGACGMSVLRTWAATDGSSSVSCNQTVSNLDLQIPVISNFPGDMTFSGTGAGCSAVATWSTPNATDNCGVSSFTSTHQSGTTFPTGSTLVTYTALDNCGNQTTAAFQVTVTCTTPCSNPTINCPGTYTTCPSNTVPSITISGNASASASPGCTSGSPVVTHVDVVNSSGPCAGQQQIIRTFTATDAANSNLFSSCSQTINLVDNVAPTISNVPSNITVSGTGTGCQVPVTWNAPTATDACGVAMLSSNISSGMVFSSGSTSIIYTAVDNCGNTNTASFTVTVTCSNPTCTVPPVISCPSTYTSCPTNGVVSPSISGFATAVAGGTNCGTPGVTYFDVISNSGSCANSKLVQRTWTANDPVSGLNSSCVQTLNLIDNTAPFFTTACPSGITLTGTGNNCSAAATYTIPVASDLCSASNVIGTSNGQVVTSGSTFTQGTHLVTYTATDNCGNAATCAFNVTINCQGCNTNPIISCPSSTTVCVGTATHPNNLGYASATAGAFCPTPSVNYSDVVTSNGPCAGAQVIQRTWTATYSNQGGYSASCVQMITLADNSAPVISNCPNNVTVTSSTTPVTWNTPFVTDACGTAQLSSNYNSGSTFPSGTTTVLYSAVDNCGNAANCSFTVTVNVPQGGFTNCPSDMTLQCGGTGGTVATWNVPTYNGACSVCDNGAYIPGFIYMGSYNGSQYYCSLAPATWPTAKSISESNGGHLADINSAGENAHLASQLTIQSAWIGLSDYGNEGNFSWCSDAPVTYTNWYQGQPNNYNNQQDYCELMNDGKWNDQYNSYSLEFIMEIPCTYITQTSGPAPGTTLQSGSYRVAYAVQDACGGFATCSFNITVESGLTVTCPADINVTAPTAAGIACTWDEPSSYSCCNSCNNTGGAIPGFIYMGSYNGSQYYCSLNGASWPTAQQTCINNGGNLAVINSAGENHFLANIIPLASAWIGCSDIGSEGNFSWVNGDPLTYTNWYAGQPNNYNGAQHCVELLNDGTWNDQYSTIALEYIMEVSDCITTTQTAGPTPGSVCAPGNHTVSYTVQDGCGNVKTCSFNINVSAPSGGGGSGYCNSGGINSTNHYINACGFGTISNTSGNNGGYHDFTNQCTTVNAGTSYPLQLTPGFGGGKPHKVYWTVWIDYNMDGDFNDNYEFVAYGCGNKTLSGSVTIPYGVWNGTTTMRVSMKYGGYATDPCETFLYGETEDYCVTVTGGDFGPGDDITLREAPTDNAIELIDLSGSASGISVYPNPVSNVMTIDLVNVEAVESVHLYNIEGKLIREINNLTYSTKVNASDLQSGIYILKAQYNDGNIITERVIVQH